MNKTTKSAQFTPGPWQISAIQNEPEKMSIIDADMCFVAEVWQTYIDGESRQQAHATLIAAAPAMYEALKTLHGVLDQRMSDGRTLNQHLGKELFECFYGPAIAARAAIAKAEGV